VVKVLVVLAVVVLGSLAVAIYLDRPPHGS
jgi:hypothetical protein